jgi:TRAP transporter TAXI family solute receptor
MNVPARFRLVALILTLAVGDPACYSAPHVTPVRVVRIATGSYEFASFAQSLEGSSVISLPDVEFQVVPEPRVAETVQRIQRGDLDVGFAFASALQTLASDEIDKALGVSDRVSGIAVLPSAALHFLVRPDSNIQQIDDLRDLRISVGAPSSGTALIVNLLLRASGLDVSRVFVDELTLAESTDRLTQGTLSAAFGASMVPSPFVEQATRRGLRLVSILGEPLERLLRDVPFLKVVAIPSSTYPGQPQAIRTVGTDTLMICRQDLDETVVYAITKVFFEALPSLASSYQALRATDLRRVSATPIRLHPGAARYYRERELSR